MSAALLHPPALYPQTAPHRSGAAGDTLRIVVLQGEDAANSIANGTAEQIVVEVRDETENPVSGVTVLFELPQSGPGGVFQTSAGMHSQQSTVTNAQGQAATEGFLPNNQLGRFTIRVTASSGKQSGQRVVHQTNLRHIVDATPRRKPRTLMYLLIAGAAAGTVAAIALSRGSDTPSAAAPPAGITIAPGAITVGGPR
jgi:hypothetical protein